MKTQEQTIQTLQATAAAILSGSQQHYMHATINKQAGYHKLAARMLEESESERAEAAKFITRIIELGGTPVMKAEELPVLNYVQEQIEEEYREQQAAEIAINQTLASIQNDQISKRLYEDYIADEYAHMTWLRQQLQLINSIGIQNYLAAQI